MSSQPKKGKSGVVLGVLLVLASLIAGWLLIVAPPKPSEKPKENTKTSIKVSIQPAGSGGLVVSRIIDCPGDKRCARVEKLTLRDFQPPKGMMCSQQSAGPSLAWVVGTIRGRSVQYQLDVSDGCKIAVWNRLAPVLGLPRSGNRSGI